MTRDNVLSQPSPGIPFDYIIDRSERQRARVIVEPSGTVEIRTPFNYSDEQVEALVRRRLVWILRQRARFNAYRPRDPERTYQSGEAIRYLGRQYRLRVERAATEGVCIRGRRIHVIVNNDAEADAIRGVVLAWLRERASVILTERFDECMAIAGRHGIDRPKVQIRMMTRRWGSCTPAARVLLNPKLVQTPVDCIDYVILHEFCHLRAPRHGPRFYRLLDLLVPDWRQRKQRLDRIALPEW